MEMIKVAFAAGLATLAVALTGTAGAQDLPKLHFKALIHDSPSPHVKLVETPFWNEVIPKASGGQITADANPLDQLGVADEAVLRLLKLGAFDFASFDIVKLGGDDPRFEGCDLSGLTFTFEQARAGCNAWRATMDRIMQKNWNTKLLAIGTAPPQAIWCSPEIHGVDDLKGKKIRVYSKTMIDFANAVGATPININFREVVTSLQNKVVDCAVTGTAVGNVSGWIDVTKYLMPISLGWAINVHTVNLNTWKRLDAKTQAFFTKQFAEMEDRFWATMKASADDAENCNVGKQPCKLGKLANMTVVKMSAEDQAKFKTLMQNTVLKGWAKRAGPEAAKEWTDTVGKALGMEAKP
jgi:TRAP-type C4-dicarboxylate transport system substrate-binding protein